MGTPTQNTVMLVIAETILKYRKYSPQAKKAIANMCEIATDLNASVDEKIAALDTLRDFFEIYKK